MPLKSRRRVIAWYETAIGILVLGWWTAALAGGDVAEVEAGNNDIWFHIAAEATMALLLIAGGRLLLRGNDRLGIFVSGVGLGTLLYSVINAAGHYAELGEWAAVGMFGVLGLTAVAAIVGLVMPLETAVDRTVDTVLGRMTAEP